MYIACALVYTEEIPSIAMFSSYEVIEKDNIFHASNYEGSRLFGGVLIRLTEFPNH
jgi:hypothetical protein